jgi:hypothetical protein
VLSQSLHSYTFRTRRILSCALGSAIAAMGAFAAPTMASEAASKTCEGQAFSQPFTSFGDSRDYTLAPGGEFNGPSTEGWTFAGGAHLVTAMRPNGDSGGALALPSGGSAISPPICVTLSYPIARVWVQGALATRGVSVSVSYANTSTEAEPKSVGSLGLGLGIWTLAEFRVDPQLAGTEEAPRDVRFVFAAKSKLGESRLYDLYIDPRMK